MQLIITSQGSILKVKEGCFLIRIPVITSARPSADREEKEFQVAVGKVQSIVVATGIMVTSDALKLAVEHNIDVIFLDGFGNPYGRVWHCRMGSTAKIRRRQIEVADTEEGLSFVKEWISTKTNNQIEFIEKLLRARDSGKSEIVEISLSGLKDMLPKISSLDGDVESVRGTLMGFEGTAGRLYFDALSDLIPERWKFNGRSRQPAKDNFNCFLNYGYGVLYGVVERACILAGLDPYVGFLHVDNYGKKSLVFDLIEPYRILADSTVFYLFSGRQVKQEHCDNIPNGLILNKEGKDLLIGALNEILEKTVRHKGRNIKQKDIIQFECHRLANQLLGKNPAEGLAEEEVNMEKQEI